MSTTDLFGDFCLACDRQTDGNTFCSQACRLSELEFDAGTAPMSSSYDDTRSNSSKRTTSFGGSKFQLPPAYDFTNRRQSSSTSISTSSSSSLSTSLPAPKSPTSSKLTDKARSELRDYVGGFDQTRTLRRRVSLQGS